MTLEEITDKVGNATAGDSLIIIGYLDSSGNVKDITVRLLDKVDGYKNILAESLKVLDSGVIAVTGPHTADAIKKLREQYTASLGGLVTRKFTTNEVLIPHATCPALEVSSLHLDAFVLRHLVRTQDKVRAAAPVSVKMSRRDPVNVECERIKDLLPIGAYIGRLILHPDRVRNIERTAS